MDGNIIFRNVDPVIIWLTDTFPLKYYGLFFATGLMPGMGIVKYIYHKEKIPTESLDKLLICVAIGKVAGARFGHCLFYDPGNYTTQPIKIFLPIGERAGFWQFTGFEGLASHGGAIGVLIAIDKVRRREVKNHKELKESRYALLKNPENLTEKQGIKFEQISSANYQVSKAWQVRETFKDLFAGREEADFSLYMK